MKAYWVGGVVRDELLGLPLREKDWVVIGETPESLKALGFRQVGQDFPVFLHPHSHEEYALARKEKKIASGHQGFTCQFSPEIRLEEDLFRRDLTINAIAKDGSQYIDPCHGREDLRNRVLRHVSPAFREDPLRVLRVARFLSQLSPFDFHIAPETLELMKTMVQHHDLSELSSERVWGEIQKALNSPAPEKFFQCMIEIGATAILSSSSFTLPSQSIPAHFSLSQKFAWFFYPFIYCLNFTPPAELKAFTLLVGKNADFYRVETDPDKLLNALQQLDALRRPERFQAWLEFYEALQRNSDPRVFLQEAAQYLSTLDLKSFTESLPKSPLTQPIKTAVASFKRAALSHFIVSFRHLPFKLQWRSPRFD